MHAKAINDYIRRRAGYVIPQPDEAGQDTFGPRAPASIGAGEGHGLNDTPPAPTMNDALRAISDQNKRTGRAMRWTAK